MSATEAARGYCACGWAPIPVPALSKAPAMKRWQRQRITEDGVPGAFAEDGNVGVLLGEPSDGLVDVDLDWPEARRLAPELLPHTGAVFGRSSSPGAHRLYVVPRAATMKFELPAGAGDDPRLGGAHGRCVLELRADGCQTIFPGSTHPSGEAVKWERDGEPAACEPEELMRAAGRLATVAALARLWPEPGARDDAARAVTGALVRDGLDPAEVSRLVRLAAEAAWDEEAAQRGGKKALRAADRLDADAPTEGWPAACERLGVPPAVAEALRGWLGVPREEPWPEPVDVLGDEDAAPPFPTGLLPGPFAALVRDVAERHQCPADYAAIPLLCEAAALAGRRLTVRPRQRDDRWVERPALWGMTVGPPGDGKSPAAAEVLEPVRRIHRELLDAFNAELEVWERTPDGEERGPRPEPAIAYTQDTTVEALAKRMEASPGILVHRDELAGWLGGMNKYRAGGRGDDRQFFLETWSGGTYTVDRRGADPFAVVDLFAGVFGTIQPGKLRDVLGAGGEDGLVQRFGLMAYPLPRRHRRDVDQRPDHGAIQAAEEHLRAVSRAGRDGDPRTFRFGAEAGAVFGAWMERHLNRAEEENEAFRAHLAKYPALFARLALVLHLMGGAVERERVRDQMGDELVATLDVDDEIGAGAAEAARDLLDRYLEPHARRVYGKLALGSTRAGAIAIAEWIRREGRTEFNVGEVQARGWSGLDERRAVEDALRYLADHGWLRLDERHRGPRGGRPTTRCRVNPRVFGVFGDGQP